MSQNQNPPANARDLWAAIDTWCGKSWTRPENWSPSSHRIPSVILRPAAASNGPDELDELQGSVRHYKNRAYITDIDGVDVMPPLRELAALAVKGQIIWWARPYSEIAPYQPMPAAALENFGVPVLSEKIHDVMQHLHTGDLVWHPRFWDKPLDGNAHLARRNAEKWLTNLFETHVGNYLPWTEEKGFEECKAMNRIDCAGLKWNGWKEALAAAKRIDGRTWKKGAPTNEAKNLRRSRSQ